MTQPQPAKVIALPERELSGPELAPILALHRHTDGVLTFHSKNEAGEWRNLFGVRAEHLRSMFPEFVAQLTQDTYLSVNAYWNWETGRHYIRAAQARNPDRLRYLAACYVDLDIYRVDLSFGDALDRIIELQDQGAIPAPSIIVRARGMWLMWALHSRKDPSQPQTAHTNEIRQYLAINEAIGARFAELGADAAARDALRCVRTPGSVHSGIGQPVRYWVQVRDSGEPYSYSLRELAEAFGVEMRRADPATERALRQAEAKPGERPRSHSQVNRQRLADFAVIRAQRGGFAEGHRNRAALLLAILLRRSRMDRDHAQKQVERLGQQCRPPLDAASCRAAVNSAFSRDGCYLKDRTISSWLDITPAEAALLERLPAAARFEPSLTDTLPLMMPPGASERRAVIREIVAAQGAVPSCRAMEQMLAARGIEVSHVTVAQDYRALGFSARPEIAKRVVPITCGEKCNLSVGG